MAFSCWLLAAAALVADGCALLPRAAGCCYYHRGHLERSEGSQPSR